jgi:hypothetical protein
MYHPSLVDKGMKDHFVILVILFECTTTAVCVKVDTRECLFAGWWSNLAFRKRLV